MRKQHYITVLFFSLVICVPLILHVFGIKVGVSDSENRKITEAPSLEWKKTKAASTIKKPIAAFNDLMEYKGKFNFYYEDNFPLKPILFDTYGSLHRDIFGVDPIPEKVVAGKDGWYFLGDSYSEALLESKARVHFSEEELKKTYQSLLEKQQWLEDKGITYYVAVAPNKHSVYGEFLPIEKDTKNTKLEQLKRLMKPHRTLFTDLSPIIKKNEDSLLYYKTNTHWNDLGAFWGYRQLIETIRKDYPMLEPLTIDDLTISSKTTLQEDLTKMLGIEIEETSWAVACTSPQSLKVANEITVPSSYKGVKKNYEFRFKSDVNDLKVVMFRDSFGTKLIQYLAENFGEVVFIWDYGFDRELIKKERPDIVILEAVERNIEKLAQ